MTPEQEARLGRMMLEHAYSNGHIKKIPPTAHHKVGGQPGVTDAVIVDQIERLLRLEGIPPTRINIIDKVDAGTTRTDRCLRKMEAAGTIRLVKTCEGFLWQIIE
jgi:hypothetical protein|tara:strand:+ start:1673 stop:1987 length:315 start_codon:yes stop_codon:yes gene_type:complete